MIGRKALARMQAHSTHLASTHRLPQPLPSAAAVNTVALIRVVHRPVANKAPVYSSWGDWMHVSTLAGIGGRYLLQQTLAEVEQARLLVVHAPQLVGVADTRIE